MNYSKLENRCSLQETHSTPDAVKKQEKEWKENSFWHSGPISKLSGLAILIKENSNIEIINAEKYKEGKIKLEKNIFQILKIFSPIKP